MMRKVRICRFKNFPTTVIIDQQSQNVHGATGYIAYKAGM